MARILEGVACDVDGPTKAHAVAGVASVTLKGGSAFATVFCIAMADLCAVSLSALLSVYYKSIVDPGLPLSAYWGLWPAIPVLMVAMAGARLYSVGTAPADELRRIFYCITLVYFAFGSATFIARSALLYSRAVFLTSWALSVFLTPLGRGAVRALFSRCRWWGRPAIILGAGQTGRLVVETLRAMPSIGLKPVGILDDQPDAVRAICNVPVIGKLDRASELAKHNRIRYAIVAMPGLEPKELLPLLERHVDTFPNLIVIPNLFGIASLSVPARDLGGILGIGVKQQLLLPQARFAKRLMDLIICCVGGIVVFPLLLFLALLVKLTSRGPVFYSQTRLGRVGRKFNAWKFRSMAFNADELLKAYLEKHPELRQEWEETHKLKDDPRVTLVGAFLRKTSLDELPQLWNVVKGEMSLVGPRPIVSAEVEKYGRKIDLYYKVRPGITGMWQVSGRNDTTYEQRVDLDAYYVRNWSPWLDLYLLARTVPVVLFRKGAY